MIFRVAHTCVVEYNCDSFDLFFSVNETHYILPYLYPFLSCIIIIANVIRFCGLLHLQSTINLPASIYVTDALLLYCNTPPFSRPELKSNQLIRFCYYPLHKLYQTNRVFMGRSRQSFIGALVYINAAFIDSCSIRPLRTAANGRNLE